ncbi:hypothetical protein [Pseudooceanicola sp. HF7]|uniref:hypothetical protein n=1 Tax=Pseudooceanicola sp. HF7 TaxID=2721560 RepID=UPI001C379AE3|nr:hypothetical protein [Pseudooceanicola sp. HF7]
MAEHNAPIKYILGTSVPPLAFKTMRAIAVRVIIYNVRFIRSADLATPIGIPSAVNGSIDGLRYGILIQG